MTVHASLVKLVGRSDNIIYDITIAKHQMLCCHLHRLPGIRLHQAINQANKTNIYSALCCKRIRR